MQTSSSGSPTARPLARRTVLRWGVGALGAAAPGLVLGRGAAAAPAARPADPARPALLDPATQPMFREAAPNALDPSFLFKDLNEKGAALRKPDVAVRIAETFQQTGLVSPRSGRRLNTRVWGYGDRTVSWPGQTIQVMSADAGGSEETLVRWSNELQGRKHLLPVDTNLHWCFGIDAHHSANGVDYTQYSIERDGVPIITHLHGGHTDFRYDGNPEFFYTPDNTVVGPQWDLVEGGFTTTFHYDNTVPAGNLWYHDHALGITRLNVYAGLAGLYFVRDRFDTGLADNPLGLPAFPYELAYAIQDRMFTERGELFWPAYPGDPAYDDFITEEGVELPEDRFPGGGPTALAEFFGDHVLVNGTIWPKAEVEPRRYRMRLLNGCDSRFMVLRLVAVEAGATDLRGASAPLPFHVVGADQGLGTPSLQDTVILEPGGRIDLVVDFSGLRGRRVVMRNVGGDAPFGGAFGDALEPDDLFEDRRTDRVMAFDVVRALDRSVPDRFDPSVLADYGGVAAVTPPRVRRVALFEGRDEFGRLQPLLGTVADDLSSATAHTWADPTTETPLLGTTEEWEIYNFTMDAHPVHLHLVNFEILGRRMFTYDEGGTQAIHQHDGSTGTAVTPVDIELGDEVHAGRELYERAPRDMVTALPGGEEGQGQMVRVRAHFDRAGRYVWHCHILSHEDHEMMRVLQVVPE